MAKFPMDLSKFKKIGSDAKCTTLVHPDGHEVKIAHKALSPKMRSQLASLDTGAEKTKREQAKGSPKMFADGGDVTAPTPQETPQAPAPEQSASAPQAAQAPVVVNVNGGQPQAPQTPSESIPHYIGSAVRQAVGDTIGALKGAVAPVGQAATGLVLGLAGVDPNAPQPAPQPEMKGPAPASVPQPAPQPQAPSDPYGTQAYYDNYSKGLAEQKAGIGQEAQAQGAMGKAEAVQLAQNIQNQQDQQKSYQDHYAGLEQERQAFMHDIQNQHIDPEHYWNNKSTVGKVAGIIGIILGGFGAAAGQENGALSVLNAHINRDIDAQKAELGKKENLLSQNMKQFNNLKDATDMTRVMQMDIVSNQLKKAAADATDPLARARALQASGKLDMEAAPILSQMAMRKSLLQGAANGKVDPARVVNLIVPEHQRAAANKELQDAQNAVALRDDTLRAFDQLVKLNTLGNRLGSPLQTSRQIEAIKGTALDKLTKDISGRVTPETVKLVGSGFSKLGNDEKTNAVIRARMFDMLSQGMHYPILDTYGIKISRPSGSGPSIPESAPVMPKGK